LVIRQSLGPASTLKFSHSGKNVSLVSESFAKIKTAPEAKSKGLDQLKFNLKYFSGI
jgi:hypothetical protein